MFSFRWIGFLLGFSLCATPAVVMAQLPQDARVAHDTGNYALLGVDSGVNAALPIQSNILGQLQQIQQASALPSLNGLQQLVAMLGSQYPLARRKAAHVLLDKAKTSTPDIQHYLSQSLQPGLLSTDDMVQRTIVRTYAAMRTPEARQCLRNFFASSSHHAQLAAVEALTQDLPSAQADLRIASELSPYSDVREAAAGSIKQ